MIFKCENMEPKYGASILVLAKFSFLILLVTQDVSAYPQRIKQNERNVIQFPDMLSDSNIEETQSDLDKLIERTFETGEKNFQEDMSKHESNNAMHRRSTEQDRMQSDSKFVFPGEISQVPICKGTTYCENISTYPEDLVNQAIQRNESLKYLAGVDMSDIVQRIDVSDDVPLCVSTELVIFPQSAENKDNEWKYIANQENFKQGIRIEKCSKERSSCNVIGGLAEGYKTSCKQKYVYRQLAAIQTDGKIVPDTFRFPSSCCCHVSFSGHSLARIGIDINDQKSQITPVKARRRK